MREKKNPSKNEGLNPHDSKCLLLLDQDRADGLLDIFFKCESLQKSIIHKIWKNYKLS